MPHAVDFSTVSTIGLESSPVAAALAGLQANEARYFKNKYDHDGSPLRCLHSEPGRRRSDRAPPASTSSTIPGATDMVEMPGQSRQDRQARDAGLT